jgi:hypothetical protein
MDEFLSALDPLIVLVLLAVSGALGAVGVHLVQRWLKRRPR